MAFLHVDRRAADLAARLSDVPGDHFTPEELARFLGVSLDSVRRWALTGAGPAFARVGPKRLFPKDAVRAWLRTRSTRCYFGDGEHPRATRKARAKKAAAGRRSS